MSGIFFGEIVNLLYVDHEEYARVADVPYSRVGRRPMRRSRARPESSTQKPPIISSRPVTSRTA
jgi:hypothetical protein